MGLTVSGVNNQDVKTQNPLAAKPKEETSFSVWTNKCADSIKDVDTKTGEPVYGSDVEPFDMAGKDFRTALEVKDYAKAGEVYKQKTQEVAAGEIAAYDTDGDGAISREEQVKYDMADCEKKYGKLDDKFKSKIMETSLRANLFMDLNKDGKVDKKEMAAYLYAMDSNNDKKIANGQVSRDEYTKSTAYFEAPLTQQAGTFRGMMRACYKGLFGIDPATK